MDRYWARVWSAAVVAAVGGIGLGACAHDDASLFVYGVLEPPQPSGNTCTYTASPTAPFITRGLVDGLLTDAYSPELLIGSTLIERANASAPNSETARIAIQGAQVKVVDPTNNSVWMNNTVLASGMIEPALATTPSYAAIGTTIMDAQAIQHFTPAIGTASKLAIVYVKFYGTTLGGQSIESNEFQYPVDVCAGCLIYFPPNAVAQNYCSGAIAGQGGAKACVVGQDQQTDCQQCIGNPACCPPGNPACGGTCCAAGKTCTAGTCG